ncbi:hypothetical protein ACFYOV_14980 [Streptomyces sp. NPDC005931]|uniref:hypothetical protein n=1 Tax=Streptomyces sp. NPDC005931 TaxID=3364737 RepID=UPI00368336CF
MAVENGEAFQAWQRLKPNTEFAVRALSSALEDPQASPDDILDAYLFAKRTLAHSMQSLIRSQLPSSGEKFHEVRERIREEMLARFGRAVPEKYLNVPYGTKANEELFAVLHQSLGQPVDIARLRTINGDDVHTERRIRELRELGLDITAITVNGRRHYTLTSLELDGERIHTLVFQGVSRAKGLGHEEKQEILSRLEHHYS